MKQVFVVVALVLAGCKPEASVSVTKNDTFVTEVAPVATGPTGPVDTSLKSGNMRCETTWNGVTLDSTVFYSDGQRTMDFGVTPAGGSRRSYSAFFPTGSPVGAYNGYDIDDPATDANHNGSFRFYGEYDLSWSYVDYGHDATEVPFLASECVFTEGT